MCKAAENCKGNVKSAAFFREMTYGRPAAGKPDGFRANEE
jgi:hypothetical protein